MTASKVFLFLCLSFIAGIFISSLGILPGSKVYLLLPGLILGLILISVFWRYKKSVIIGFCILFLVLGIWRHQTVEVRLQQAKNIGEIVSLIGIVAEEPDIKENSVQLIIRLIEVRLIEVEPQSIKGKILVTTSKYPEYQYGDKLKIVGKLEIPSEDINGFNYQDYLKKDGIYSLMAFPKIEKISEGFGNPLMNLLFSFKNKFKKTVRVFLSPPQEGILEALVFGDEENISKDWKTKLNQTGTRHLTAVSGMNITIIAFLILSFALNIGLWRKQAFYLSVFLLVLYVSMIGAPASAVRAGIMAVFLMTAQYLGRTGAALRGVIFAAVLMLVWNPLLLRLDIGFQLSFLAILGIIFLQPVFFNWFKKTPNPKIFPVRTTLSATLAAQVFTLPVLVYNFGYIPLVSPITNILIVPFLAPFTIAIFIFGLLAMIFQPLGWLLSWPIWLILTYIVKIVEIFS